MKRIADYDRRHFSFDRRSGLPDNYFAEPKRNVDAVVCWAMIALGAVTIALIAMGFLP